MSMRSRLVPLLAGLLGLLTAEASLLAQLDVFDDVRSGGGIRVVSEDATSSDDAEPGGDWRSAPLAGPRVVEDGAPGVRHEFAGSANRMERMMAGPEADLRDYLAVLDGMDLRTDQRAAVEARLARHRREQAAYRRAHRDEYRDLLRTLREAGLGDLVRGARDDDASARLREMVGELDDETRAEVVAAGQRLRALRDGRPGEPAVMSDLHALLDDEQRKDFAAGLAERQEQQRLRRERGRGG